MKASKQKRDLAFSLNNLVNIASCNSLLTDYVSMSLNFIQQTLGAQKNVCQGLSPPMMSIVQVPKYQAPQPSLEKQKLAIKLGGFDYKSSEAWRKIVELYGTDIKRTTLCDIAKYIAEKKGLKMDRDSKRRKDVLLKWYNDNWSVVYGILEKVKVKDNVPIFPESLGNS